MKITERAFIKKAVENYAEYRAKKEKEQAYDIMQNFLEDLGIALKNEGIKEINGANFTLRTED